MADADGLPVAFGIYLGQFSPDREIMRRGCEVVILHRDAKSLLCRHGLQVFQLFIHLDYRQSQGMAYVQQAPLRVVAQLCVDGTSVVGQNHLMLRDGPPLVPQPSPVQFN